MEKAWACPALLIAGLLAPLPRAAAQPLIRIPRITQKPSLGEVFWREWAQAGPFVQRIPGDGSPASQPTEAYLAYDERNLYVVFLCGDTAGAIRANLSKRDQISDDDQVTLYLDTFHDRRRAYVFSSNARGIQRDGMFTEGQSTDATFDTLWYSEARLGETGFSVLMTIPFRSLRFSGEPVKRWGIALRRRIVRNQEELFWPHVSNRFQGLVQQFAALEGIEGVVPGGNFQMIPYAYYGAARLLEPRVSGYRTEDDLRGGLDAKLVIQDALTLDMALNPDFSQVESDDPQSLVNRRFEVFFPEKRPFFVENAGTFRTPINLFFSRRIVDPRAGMRLTGKAGNWALGAVLADDRASGAFGQSPDAASPQHASEGAGRLQREFGRQSSVGILGTRLASALGSNDVLAADTRLRLNPNWTFTGQVAGSRTRTGQAVASTGSAVYALVERAGRSFNYSSSYTGISPGFHTELGFIPRNDIRRMDQSVGYRWWREGGRLQGFGPSFAGVLDYDHEGRLQDWSGTALFEASFTGQTGFTVSHTQAYEFYVRGFRRRVTSATFYTGLLRWLSAAASWDRGTGINYRPVPGSAPFLGDSSEHAFDAILRPIPRLRVDQSYIHSALSMRGGGPRIFSNHLSRTKVNFQFTRELSVRLILDYSALHADSRRIVQDDRSKRLTGDLLVTYQLNAWTAFHAGYQDRYGNLRLDSRTGTLAATGALASSTARQFFAKFSYLVRF